MRTTDVVTAFAPRLLASGIEWMIASGVVVIVHGDLAGRSDLARRELDRDMEWREMEGLRD